MEDRSINNSIVYVVDDDLDVREGLKALFESVGLRTAVFGSTMEFLRNSRSDDASCLILDVRLPGPSWPPQKSAFRSFSSPAMATYP
jgi:FixJ family two-component response regulator